MPERAEQGYTLTARVLHWITAALVLTMIPIGIAIANVDFGPWQNTLYDLHRSMGAVLLPLVLGRLIWRLTHPAPPLPADIPAIQQVAAHATHWLLYALLIAQAIAGWIATSAYRAPIRVFWLFDLPPVWREDRVFSETMFTAHKFIGISIALLLCAHIGAALFHHFIRKDGVLMRGERLRMAGPALSRSIGDLTFQEAGTALRASSILCLPMGSMEQHGPHLPLNTDTVLAEAFAGRIVARWGEAYDLWRLPPVPVGLSREHEWATGTLSLSVSGMTAYLRDLAREIARSPPARNLLIVNGHGGNRGLLEALGRELRGDFGLNLCALHLGVMMSAGADAAPDVHAGKDETSVMLALAPHLVRRERIADLKAPPDGNAVRETILDLAVSWPWSSGDKRLADLGVVGDAASASAEHGHAIVERVVEEVGAVLKQLRDNQT